jgi:hypothetical protein
MNGTILNIKNHKTKTSTVYKMSKKGSNFTQYNLLRGRVAYPVCTLDVPAMYDLDVGDNQQAEVMLWQRAQGLGMVSKPSFMEPLPSQSIRFAQPELRRKKPPQTLAPQSKAPFQEFHLQK